MNHIQPLEGSYFLCPKCNKVDYPYEAGIKEDSAPRTNIGNTFDIDKEIEEELNRVVERGRD